MGVACETTYEPEHAENMAGLRKHKKYKWKETNLALFGSDLEKEIKKASAQGEDAWKGVGKSAELRVWRIVKFKVVAWRREHYGKFYDGDSYIVLHSYHKEGSDALLYDVHFWIGKYSTQDEYGTAAYKTVELDHYLDDKAVQHREVQGHESGMFRGYFKRLELWKGGAESGFNHVEPESYEPRLLHIKGIKDNIAIKERKMRRKNLNDGDVYILDLGLTIYQWNGKSSNKDERIKALEFVQALRSDRGGRPKVETLDEEGLSLDHPFYKHLPRSFFESKKPRTAEEGGGDEKVHKFENVLYRIHERTGHDLSFKQVDKGALSTGRLHPSDVFLVDTGFHVFVWVGQEATAHEKGGGLVIAHEYVKDSKHPFLPITRVLQGQHNTLFESAFQDHAPIGSGVKEDSECLLL